MARKVAKDQISSLVKRWTGNFFRFTFLLNLKPLSAFLLNISQVIAVWAHGHSNCAKQTTCQVSCTNITNLLCRLRRNINSILHVFLHDCGFATCFRWPLTFVWQPPQICKAGLTFSRGRKGGSDTSDTWQGEWIWIWLMVSQKKNMQMHLNIC